ncbi:MAG: HAD family phosphatase [Candidatus Levyibacteriota bacterium]
MIKPFDKTQDLRAVIFDLDGLLIDSEPAWATATRILLKKLGVDYHGELREQMIGRGQRECAEIYIKHYKLKESVEDFAQKRWKVLYSFLEKNLKLMPGAKNLIRELSANNLALALATAGHQKKKAKKILQKFFLGDFFKIIISGLDVPRGKPFPHIYFFCAQKLDVSPSQCLVLEDSPNGVIAGKRAGMTVYGVNKDRELREKMNDAGADKVFHSLTEIEL